MVAAVAFLSGPFGQMPNQQTYGPQFRPASYLIRVVAECGAAHPRMEALDVCVFLERRNAGIQALDAPPRTPVPAEEVAHPYARRKDLTLAVRADGQNLTHEFTGISFAGAAAVETPSHRGLLLRYHYRNNNWIDPAGNT